MTKLESYRDQLQHYAKDGGYTAQAFLKAADATGNVSDIADAILVIAETHGIPRTDLSALAEKSAAIQALKRRQEKKDKLAGIAKRYQELSEKSGAMQDADIDRAAAEINAEAASIYADNNKGSIKTARELLAAEYPPINWVFPGLVGEGLTMLNGAPKIGKSWFVLGAALAASQGGAFLGSYKAPKPIETLYISLEDTERRLSDRLKKLKANTGNSKLRITTQWRGGTPGLDKYLAENTETGFVIIDTLCRFIGQALDDMNDYAATVNAMSQIKKIADNRKAAILIVHHTRKGGNSEKDKGDWMDAAMGSAGIAGSADASIVLMKPRPSKEDKDKPLPPPELRATGRDAGDIHHALKFDADCGWAICTAKQETTKSTNPNPRNPRGNHVE